MDRKSRDFRTSDRGLHVLHLDLDSYLEAAATDPDLRFAVEAGVIQDLALELRDPVLSSWVDRSVVTCPELIVSVLASEPAEIHRAFVEGAFFRKLFRFFVPAAHDGGALWEASQQVREIMQRHFALQLVVTETLLGEAA